MFSKIKNLAFHVWLAGAVNVIALLAQFYTLLAESSSKGYSITMGSLMLYVQITYALVGRKNKDKGLEVCMWLSALINIAIIVTATILRHLS